MKFKFETYLTFTQIKRDLDRINRRKLRETIFLTILYLGRKEIVIGKDTKMILSYGFYSFWIKIFQHSIKYIKHTRSVFNNKITIRNINDAIPIELWHLIIYTNDQNIYRQLMNHIEQIILERLSLSSECLY